MRRRHMGVDGGRDPRRRRWQELREQRRRGIFLLPSLLTTGNLFCGFYAIIRAAENRYTEAAVAIFVAMVMDMLDGKVARLTKTTTQFGVEFALQHIEHVAAVAPVVGEIARRILHHPDPQIADIERAPKRFAGFAGMRRRRDLAPVRDGERQCWNFHAKACPAVMLDHKAILRQ